MKGQCHEISYFFLFHKSLALMIGSDLASGLGTGGTVWCGPMDSNRDSLHVDQKSKS